MAYIFKLFRPKVSIMVGLSAFAGACLYDYNLNLEHIYAAIAAVLLSAGCSAINQYQEQSEDKLMSRTNSRPLPAEQITNMDVIRLALVLISLSAAFIILAGGITGLVFIPITLVIYNYIYTPMKKRTPFALLVGSVTGAIPPVLGYVTIGGTFHEKSVLIVAAVLYVWQTPHFALLSEKYRTDYAKAGFKTLSGTYGKIKAHKFITIWLAAFVCMLLLVPSIDVYCFHITSLLHTTITLLFAAALFVFRKNVNITFHILNLSMVIFFLMLVVDRIII